MTTEIFYIFKIITLKQEKFSRTDPVLIHQISTKLQSDPILIRPKLASVLIQSDPVLICAYLWQLPLKAPIVVKCSVLQPSVTHLWYMITLVRKHVSINSIQFENNKHHCRNCNWSLKIFYWILHRHECWLRLPLRLELQILTPAPAENPDSGRSPLRHSGSVIICDPYVPLSLQLGLPCKRRAHYNYGYFKESFCNCYTH